jgi:5-methylcytosine-specific restriction endonuclease McrA
MQQTASSLESNLSDAANVVEDLDMSNNFDTEMDALEEFLDAMQNIVSSEKELYESLFDSESAKERIAMYLKHRQREPVKSAELARIAGIKDYTRRIRELRNERGFIIATSRTNAELAPDEYVLVEVRDVQDKRRLDSQTRDEYLEKNPCCERCGFDPREHNPGDVSGNRYLEVDHIEAYENFDTSEEANSHDNLQTLCNVCHNGKGSANDRWT